MSAVSRVRTTETLPPVISELPGRRASRAAIARSVQGLGNSVQLNSSGCARPRSARVVHTLAIRRKCCCNARLGTSPANCIQSAAKRMHSSACFRKSDSDTALLLETATLKHCTASNVLSVVYATEKSEESGCPPVKMRGTTTLPSNRASALRSSAKFRIRSRHVWKRLHTRIVAVGEQRTLSSNNG
jgi:hypothetical protein